MKKLFFGTIATIITISCIYIPVSCIKEDTNAASENITKTSANTYEYENTYIKVGLGTHLFDNCKFDLPCGPCPGICVKLGFAVYKDVPPISCGEGVFEVKRISDEKMYIRFLTSGFTNGAQTGLENDYTLSTDEASALGFDSAIVTIQNGIYDVDFDHSTYGETSIPLSIQTFTNE